MYADNRLFPQSGRCREMEDAGRMAEDEQMKDLLRRSRSPLYLQVACAIRSRIDSGEWAPGVRIPSLDELAQEHGVSRITARQAVTNLVEERRLVRQQGTGTFVAATNPNRRLRMSTSWESLTRMIAGTSIDLLVDRGNAPLPPMDDVPGRPATAYQYLRRVHGRGGRPYAVLDIYLDQEVFDRAPDLYRSITVLSVLNDREKVTRGAQTLTISTADPESARCLGIAVDAPVALVRRYVLGVEGRLLYFANVIYRGDYVCFDIDLICKADKM